MTNTDFSFLDQLQVTNDITKEHVMHGITLPNGMSPTLVGRHAGETNKPYFNALLRASAGNAKLLRKGTVNMRMLEENREEDRALFVEHVITGWKDMVDGSGSDAKFSKANLVSFFKHLPNHVFDDVREFFANPINFMATALTTDQIADKGKSLPSV